MPKNNRLMLKGHCMDVKTIKESDYFEWLKYKHYAKRVPPISCAFGLYDGDNVLIGVCTYGPPARMLNDGYGLFGESYAVKTLELNRLVVNEGLPKNALSYFVAMTLKLLQKPCCVVSYADSNNGHHGYIYQATNWLYLGLTQQETVYINTNTGEIMHPRTVVSTFGTREKEKLPKHIKVSKELGGKHRYLQLLGSKTAKKQMKSNLKYGVQPYPKGDNARYDASYKPKTQMVMF